MRRALLMLLLVGCADPSSDRADPSREIEPSRAHAPPPAPDEGPNAPEAPPLVEAPAPLVDPRPDDPGDAPPIERPEALGRFHAALARTRTERAIARVTHLGDSSIGLDDLPHRLRRLFQDHYGDAGPGFVYLQPHEAGYLNRTVWLRNGAPWEDLCFIIHRCERDGHYGLGGVRVESRGGADTSIRPRDGRLVTSAELWYAAQPRGGRLRFRFGPGEATELDLRADALEDRWHHVRRDPGEHSVRITAAQGGVARAYGVVLENDGPGLVWDTLSMTGAFTHRLLVHDEAHFARQLAHRDPDLVVLSYGGNDLRRLVGGVVDAAGFTDETARLLERVRRAVPDAGCLLVGVNDHAMSGETTIRPRDVDALVAAQRAAASRAGCAYWSTLDAMGGAGSFETWRRLGLAAADQKHLSPRGRQVIAARLHAALLSARGAAAGP